MRRLHHDPADGVASSLLRAQVHGFLRATGRSLIVLPMMLAFIPIAGVVYFIGRPWDRGRLWHLRLCQAFCATVCRVAGIKVHFENRANMHFTGRDNVLLCANHMSYLDVLALASRIPTTFVTSREIRSSPVLGWICAAAGCFFTERRNRSTVQKDIGAMAERLVHRFNVALFPEGTTGDGGALLPFKRTLLEAALRSKARVVPVCIQYRSIEGRSVTRQNRDDLAWYGEMTFLPHLLRLLSLRNCEIQVTALAPLAFRVDKCRKRLGHALEEAMREEFRPIG